MGQLVITRREGQRFVMSNGGDDIIVKVFKVKHGQVRLAIEAPLSWNIAREELIQGGIHVKGSNTVTGNGSEDITDGGTSGEA